MFSLKCYVCGPDNGIPEEMLQLRRSFPQIKVIITKIICEDDIIGKKYAYLIIQVEKGLMFPYVHHCYFRTDNP